MKPEQLQNQSCPTLLELAAFAEGRLTPSRRVALESHMASCERCLDLALAGFKLPRQPLADAPLPVVGRAQRLRLPRRRRWYWAAGLAAGWLGVAVIGFQLGQAYGRHSTVVEQVFWEDLSPWELS